MVDPDPRRLVDPRYAWLALALPAEVRRFRTDDSDLASLLVESGAEAVTNDPDVEIAVSSRLRGDASAAVVPFDVAQRREGSRVRRGLGRIARLTGMKLGIRRASRALHSLGYEHTHTIAWERSVPVVAPGLPRVESRRLAHRWPMNAVVVGRRVAPGPTIFDEAVAAAGTANAESVRPTRVVFGSSGVVVADLGAAILRLAVGPAGARLDAHRRCVEELLALDPPSEVNERLPRSRAYGREGLAAWTLEERLPGGHRARLGSDLMPQCVDFLAQLARPRVAGNPKGRFQAAADLVSRECSERVGADMTRTAANALEGLAELSACFIHGDFWTGNLLLEGTRLTGVIDWSAGGTDGLPAIDALHLHLSSSRHETGDGLGDAVAEHLLSRDPFVDSEFLHAYVERVGLRLDAAKKRALVVAYWLDALARDLRDPDSVQEGDMARWESDNVTPVLRALHASGGPQPSGRARW